MLTKLISRSIAGALAALVLSVAAFAAIGVGTITAPMMAPGGGGAAMTVASGCATISNLVGGQTMIQFNTTATTCTPVLTMPFAAPDGWYCEGQDITSGHAVIFTQVVTGTPKATASVTGTTTSGDLVQVQCTPL